MADVHFLTLTNLHDRLMRPIAEHVVHTHDVSVHRMGPAEGRLAFLKSRGCKVAVLPQLPDRLFKECREAGIKTIMVQHGQYPQHWTERCNPPPDVAVLMGYFWFSHWKAWSENAVCTPSTLPISAGYGLLTEIIRKIDYDYVPGGPEILYAMPMLCEHDESFAMPVLQALHALGVWAKPHPREVDQVQGITIYPRGDSIYRCLKGLRVLVSGPSNLIFEAVLAGVPCVVPNFAKLEWLEAYSPVCTMVHTPAELVQAVEFPPEPATIDALEPFCHRPDEGSLHRVATAVLNSIEVLL